ncbi:MAG: hypothetical protein P1Q69_02525 [Candidatus Thorarchaeota archaeon]|nr:hypothetical protein [Candidatus Thorarchaeota archaeon]
MLPDEFNTSLFGDSQEHAEEEELTEDERDQAEKFLRVIEDFLEYSIETVEELDQALSENRDIVDDEQFDRDYEWAVRYLEFMQKVKEAYSEDDLAEQNHYDIAKEFGYKPAEVSWWITKNGRPSLVGRFEKRGKARKMRELVKESHEKIKKLEKISDSKKDWIVSETHRLYYKEKMTQRQIAELLGVSRGYIQKIFKDQKWLARRRERAVDSEEILRLYQQEKMTQDKIAEKLGFSRAYVHKILREILGDGDKRSSRKIDINMMDEVHRLYDEGTNLKEIAEVAGVSLTTLRRRIKEFGWTRRVSRKKAIVIDKRATKEPVLSKKGRDKKKQKQEVRKKKTSTKPKAKSKKKERKPKPKKKEFDYAKLKQLYLYEDMTQKQVAEKLDISLHEVKKRLRIKGWKKTRESVDLRELHRLYFEEGMTLEQVAERMEISIRRIQRIFKKQGWRAGPKGTVLNIATIFRMHYEDNLTDKEIAFIVGASTSKIKELLDILAEDGLDNLSDKYGSSKVRLEAKTIRENLFGNSCKLCGKTRSGGKLLAIHKKDGTPHDTDDLWNPEVLRKLNPEEWASLCPQCHKSVHWALNYLSMEWESIESKSIQFGGISQSFEIESDIESGKELRGEGLEITRADVREIRFEIFGDECFVCKRYRNNTKLILHRKDGTPHHRNSTWTVDFIKTANPDEWAMLCNRCHNGTHWMMNRLGMNWNEIESSLSNDDD